jgi:hypothetical protein
MDRMNRSGITVPTDTASNNSELRRNYNMLQHICQFYHNLLEVAIKFVKVKLTTLQSIRVRVVQTILHTNNNININIKNRIQQKKIMNVEKDENCHHLSTIHIPRIQNVVQVVPKDVVKLKIHDNIHEVKECQLENCVHLKYVSIAESVKEIKYKAFRNCSSLTSITIPNSVTSIAHAAFKGCESLTSIIIPDSVTSIRGAFEECTSLTNVTMSNSITRICGAFQRCTSLTSIEIPTSVLKMHNAFMYCESLTSVLIPKSSQAGMYEAFQGCTSLTNIVIPQSITQTRFAFYRCSSIGKRERDGMNSNNNMTAEDWVKHRFDTLPIHSACYDTDLEEDTITKLISIDSNDKKATVVLKDAMDMTALHVLCCNPNANRRMICVLKAANPDAVHMKNVNGMTPLMLFLQCRGIKELKQVPTFSTLMKLGLVGSELECILELVGNDTKSRYLLELEKRNKAGLYPFMVAASSSQCKVDSVFTLVRTRPDLLQ